MSTLVDLTGRTFGRLTVISRNGSTHSHAVWMCQCSCGNVVNIASGSLLKGVTKSCGCLRVDMLPEITSKAGKAVAKHGDYKSRLYRVWQGMLARCNYKRHRDYHNYGGRGIVVCSEWHDYRIFKAWALSNGYDSKAAYGACTIDRINNDEGYNPNNCRWTDAVTQSNNKRKV